MLITYDFNNVIKTLYMITTQLKVPQLQVVSVGSICFMSSCIMALANHCLLICK